MNRREFLKAAGAAAAITAAPTILASNEKQYRYEYWMRSNDVRRVEARLNRAIHPNQTQRKALRKVEKDYIIDDYTLWNDSVCIKSEREISMCMYSAYLVKDMKTGEIIKDRYGFTL